MLRRYQSKFVKMTIQTRQHTLGRLKELLRAPNPPKHAPTNQLSLIMKRGIRVKSSARREGKGSSKRREYAVVCACATDRTGIARS